MVGRILLIVLCILLALLLAALLIPAYVRISYDSSGLLVVLNYAKLTIPLYPGKEDATKDASQSESDTKSADEPEKRKGKINREQILYSLETLPAVLTKVLKRTGRRIRIEPLKLYILVATSDPADTAILYGKLEGVLAAALPVLHRQMKIREQDIRLFPDFCEEQMDYIMDVGIGIRPIDLLWIAICGLSGVIKWFVGFKKRATKHPVAAKKHKDTTAQTDNAA